MAHCGSRPEQSPARLVFGCSSGATILPVGRDAARAAGRSAQPEASTVARRALMCSGVVPQQPPMTEAMNSGVSP